MDDGTEADFHCRTHNLILHFKADDYNSIFQADIFNLLKTLEDVIGAIITGIQCYSIFCRHSGTFYGHFIDLEQLFSSL